jgi:hypothetical protein
LAITPDTGYPSVDAPPPTVSEDYLSDLPPLFNDPSPDSDPGFTPESWPVNPTDDNLTGMDDPADYPHREGLYPDIFEVQNPAYDPARWNEIHPTYAVIPLESF